MKSRIVLHNCPCCVHKAHFGHIKSQEVPAGTDYILASFGTFYQVWADNVHTSRGVWMKMFGRVFFLTITPKMKAPPWLVEWSAAWKGA